MCADRAGADIDVRELLVCELRFEVVGGSNAARISWCRLGLRALAQLSASRMANWTRTTANDTALEPSRTAAQKTNAHHVRRSWASAQGARDLARHRLIVFVGQPQDVLGRDDSGLNAGRRHDDDVMKSSLVNVANGPATLACSSSGTIASALV
jgi:hypothetical protein